MGMLRQLVLCFFCKGPVAGSIGAASQIVATLPWEGEDLSSSCFRCCLLRLCASDDDYQDCFHYMTMLCFKVGVVLGLILVPNGKYFGKMLGDEYSRYEPQLVKKGLSLQNNT